MGNEVLTSDGSDIEDPIYRTTRSVMVGDTDASGLIYFPVVGRWHAETFEQWFTDLGFGVAEQLRNCHGTPNVHSRIDIHKALGLGDDVSIKMWVSEAKTHSFHLKMEITESATGTLAIETETAHVWTYFPPDSDPGAPAISKALIPPWIRTLADRAQEYHLNANQNKAGEAPAGSEVPS